MTKTIDDNNDIIVPSKLQTGRDLQGVLPSGVEADSVWFGIQLLCSEVPMSVCIFPQLQVHLYNLFWTQYAQKPRLWSGGIAVSLRHCKALGIVEARRGRMAINIIVRGVQQSLRECYALLKTLKEAALLKAETFSPGSDVSELILSSRELSSLDWSKDVSAPQIAYEKADVEEAMERGGDIGPRGEAREVEDAHALMAIPATHVRLMTLDGHKSFCHKMNVPSKTGEKEVKWHELARRLGMPQYEIPARDSTAVTNPTARILQWWSRRSGRHTIQRLLEEVKAINHPEAAAVLKKELTFRLSIQPTLPEVCTPPEDGEELAEEGERGHCTTWGSIEEPILLEIAKCFSDMFDCAQLAVYLDIAQGSDFVESLQSRNPLISVPEATLKVLKKWKMEKASRATGDELHRVLKKKLNMGAIAEQFEHELLQG